MQILERAEKDPTIPVGAPLFLEDLQSNLMVVETKPRTPSPAGLSPRRSKPGTKSPVLLSPGREHSMEVIIATKRGKPGFLPPGEIAPEIDDEDAKMEERKKKARPTAHKDEFQDLREKLKREDDRRKADREELDRYRPKNIYKDDLDFDRPGYDIDDSPWDSHYQIGPDTYLMATHGPSFNSRVRDYRRTLFGDGAPLVKQGFLGVRNKDITVRERRRYTDILREKQAGVLPKSNEHATAIQKAPSLSAIERIKADIEKVAPSATRRNADGTYAPIFVSRLRDVYLKKASFVVFECSVSGSPPPNIEWLFQDEPLQSRGRYLIEQGRSIESLLFKGKFSVLRHSVDSQKEAGAHCVAKIRSLQGDPTVMREFETLKEGQHENVQHLIAAYQNDGFLYLFCEKLYEDVFSRFIQIDYYTEEQVRLTVGQLASALHWLHFRGIVHLDVNPHNVMFQSKTNWIVKLVDFGSAQFTKESVKPVELDTAWAAPELHIKETPVTVQSDVWGLGVITFCL
ncbi:Immunoglobulin I-set domain protein [Trichostrongylus colubriformis]|uniref:Immunoglobulin I-set domain protein n=1 Tax=Trichostrongylus colubriformis TaxID=6319 RepID=A0AAN8IQ65_TRICO